MNIIASIRINASNALMNLAMLVHPAQTKEHLAAVSRQLYCDRMILGDSYEVRKTISPEHVFIHSRIPACKGDTDFRMPKHIVVCKHGPA